VSVQSQCRPAGALCRGTACRARGPGAAALRQDILVMLPAFQRLYYCQRKKGRIRHENYTRPLCCSSRARSIADGGGRMRARPAWSAVASGNSPALCHLHLLERHAAGRLSGARPVRVRPDRGRLADLPAGLRGGDPLPIQDRRLWRSQPGDRDQLGDVCEHGQRHRPGRERQALQCARRRDAIASHADHGLRADLRVLLSGQPSCRSR